jgi:hypothetical protein
MKSRDEQDEHAAGSRQEDGRAPRIPGSIAGGDRDSLADLTGFARPAHVMPGYGAASGPGNLEPERELLRRRRGAFARPG